ncbi:MAG TPA: hypothetical protein ENJ09_11675 [Planctomycetes bacterium]|nr:hypothetical protein [Planctomycetota bacterium]
MLRRAFLGLALAALSAPAVAQCLTGPDNLTGSCWTPTTANLPIFPATTLPGTAITWQQCQPAQQCMRIMISAPLASTCAQYKSAVTAFDCNGQPVLAGSMLMDYTRTWQESLQNPPKKYQVYRFVVKIDMSLAGGVGLPSFAPTCVPTTTAFYYGYMDYAFDCATGGAEAALVLFHNCDNFIHHPLSSTPGTFHPGTTYALVAPSTTANPFLAGAVIPPGGSLTAEAVRNVPSTSTATCQTEDIISSGVMGYIGSGCFCSPTPGAMPPQLSARRLFGKGSCINAAGFGTSFQTSNTMPNFPWFHMMTTAIGRWTTTANYPGPEVAWVDEAPVFYRDGCTPSSTGTPQAYGEVFYGGSTLGGYTIDQVGGPVLTDKFTDLASNTSWQVPGPPPNTFMGNVLPTRHLIYVNLP